MRRYDILPLSGKGGPVLYRLVFTIKACADFEELAGIPLFDIPMTELGDETLTTLLWVSLLDQQPNATKALAKKLIKHHKQHAVLKLINAIKRAQGEQVEAGESKPLEPRQFWKQIAEMTAAVNLKPWEAERYTFAEITILAKAVKAENEATMERLAWQTALLLNPHVKQPVTVDDLLGREKKQLDPDEVKRKRQELFDQFADVRKKRGHVS